MALPVVAGLYFKRETESYGVEKCYSVALACSIVAYVYWNIALFCHAGTLTLDRLGRLAVLDCDTSLCRLTPCLCSGLPCSSASPVRVDVGPSLLRHHDHLGLARWHHRCPALHAAEKLRLATWQGCKWQGSKCTCERSHSRVAFLRVLVMKKTQGTTSMHLYIYALLTV